MVCKKCGSSNVSVQMVQVEKKHGIIWWIFIGWWWVPIKWLCFTLFALILALFGRKGTKNIKMCVCQDCGYSWKI